MDDIIQVLMGQNFTEGKSGKVIPSVIGLIRAVDLVRNSCIPLWNQKTKKGYQRDPVTSRITKLAGDLHKEHVDITPSIVVSRRIGKDRLIEKDDKIYLPAPKEEGEEEEEYKFIIIDGQHRLRALEKIIDEDRFTNKDKWKNYQISFVCLLGTDEHEEMRQFHIINSNAKSVKTDLSNRLLLERSKVESKLLSKLEKESKEWILKAEEITEEIAKIPIWKNLIRFPNQKIEGATIGSAAINNSLKKAFEDASFSIKSQEEQVKIINSFWDGIKIIIPEAFKENRKDFSIQKTVGVYVFHNLLPIVYAHVLGMKNKDEDIVDPQKYADILKPGLEHLKHTYETELADFWTVGGRAGSFSSAKGRHELFLVIKEGIERRKI